MLFQKLEWSTKMELDKYAFRVDFLRPFMVSKFFEREEGERYKICTVDRPLENIFTNKKLPLSVIDTRKIKCVSMLQDGEQEINGHEKLNRLYKSVLTPLDAYAFRAFYEDQSLSPEEWERFDSYVSFSFPGTLFGCTWCWSKSACSYITDYYVLELFKNNGRWQWRKCAVKSKDFGTKKHLLLAQC